MENEGRLKEVYFSEWCSKCKHFEKKEEEEPCDECLEYPGREYSHKPEKFEAK